MRLAVVAIVAFLAACTGRGGFDPSRAGRDTPVDDLPVDDDDEPVVTDEDGPPTEEPPQVPHLIDLGPAARDRTGTMPRISLGPDANLAFAYRSANATRVEWWHDGAWEDLGATLIGAARDIDVAYRSPDAFYVASDAGTTLHQRTVAGWTVVTMPAFRRGESPDTWTLSAAAVRLKLTEAGGLVVSRCIDENVVGEPQGPYRQRAFLEILGASGGAAALWNAGQFYYVGNEQADLIRHHRLSLDTTVGGSMVGGRAVLDQLWLARISSASQSTLEHSIGGGGSAQVNATAITAMPDTTLVMAYANGAVFSLERSTPVSENGGVDFGGWTEMPAPMNSATPTAISLDHAGDTLVMAYTAGGTLFASYFDGAAWQPFVALGESQVSGSVEEPASDPQISGQKGRVCLAWLQALELRVTCLTL